MSFADDFWHDVPPDDWPGGSGYPKRKYTSRNISYNNTGNILLKRKYKKISFETSKAYLLIFKEGKIWLPKSKVIINKDASIVQVPSWLWNRVKFIKD